MFIFTKAFWAYAGERAIKTVAQAALAVIGTGAVGILAVDWQGVVSVALMAGLVSVLTSVANQDKPE
jgi:tRNA A37 threonylcarbamoyladenosine dehydratase